MSDDAEPSMVPGDLLPKDWQNEPVERPLVDDLADVLSRTVVGWESILGVDLSQAPEVQRVMARYRWERLHIPPPAEVH
jgi:hypothetical protein